MKMLFILLLLALPSRSFGSGILLSSADDFTDFANKVNSGSTYSGDTVYLGSDITLIESIDPIGTDDTHQFLGVFDGQGHAISNLTINSSSRFVGLFGLSYGLTIRNVVLDSSCSITSTFIDSVQAYVGGIIGYHQPSNGECNIENNVNMADVTFDGSTSYSLWVGGIAGILYSFHGLNSYIKNCVNYGSVTDSGTVTSEYYAALGGIVGDTAGTSSNSVYIQNCLNYGTITHSGTSANLIIGGVVTYGSRYVYVENCVSAGKISTPTTAAGYNRIGSIMGWVGSPGVYINYCYFTSDVNASSINGYGTPASIIETSNFTVCVDSELVSKLNSNATSCNWAKWFMLHLNGGSINNLAQELLVEIQGHIPDPAKEGNSFLFWCKDAGLTEKFDPATDPVDEITDLYAHWAPNNYTVTFDVSGGNSLPDDEATKTVIFDEIYGELPVPNRAGFTFSGWFADDGTKIEPYTTMTTAENHFLYANWTANEYVVVFDVNRGNYIDELAKEVRFAEKYGDLPEPNRTGYSFLGWFDENEKPITNETTVITPKHHTLYAHWIANNYFVTFDVSGGNSLPDDEATKTVIFDEEYGDLPEPNRAGYAFLGWFNDDNESVSNETVVITPKNHALYAHWDPIQYTISFDSKGGSACGNITQDFGTLLVFPEPEMTGYTFLGWFDADLATEYMADTVQAGNVTLYAKWEANNYFVTFNVNGGNPLPDDEATKTVTFAEEYDDLPEPNRTGYSFLGWLDENDENVTNRTIVKIPKNHALYAHWEPSKYTVSFNVSGGNPLSDSEATKTVTFDEIYAKLPEPNRAGFTFAGWFTGDGAKIEPYTTMTTAENHVLYANWTANEYFVVFDVSGGNSLSVDELAKEVRFADKYGDLPEPNRTGYSFIGWFDEKEKPITNETTVITPKHHTLYAHWIANNYFVTFNVSGGNSLPDEEATKTVIFDEGYGDLPEPNRTGYSFLGWLYENDKIVTNETIVITPKNHALYAHWDPIQYTISFDSRGGSACGNITQDFGTLLVFPEPEMAGYTFAGWFDADLTTKYMADTVQAGNVTLYAKWEANNYIVTFDANGGNPLPDDEATKTVTFAEEYDDLPEPNRTGYSFLGWLDENDKNVTNRTIVNTPKNHVLYAHWEPSKYTVTFNVSGGNPLPDEEATKTVTFDEIYAKLPEPNRAGFTFAGWFTDGGTKIEPYTTMTTAGNHVLYANWTANEYVVVFDVNRGNYIDELAKEVRFADKYGDLPEPNRAGYSFTGWFDEKEKPITNETTVITPKHHILYAHWIANNYFVTFDVSGGNSLPDDEATKTVTFDKIYGDLPEPNRTGYAFLGWFNDDNESVSNETVVITPKNHILHAHLTPNVNGRSAPETPATVKINSTDGGSSTPSRTGHTLAGWADPLSNGNKVNSTTTVRTPSNHTLYAHWAPNNYTVTFDVSGGNSLPDEEESAKTVTFDEGYGDLPEPNRTGYSFTGWFDEDSNPITNETIVNIPKNHTLYARWTTNTYTLTFDFSNGTVTVKILDFNAPIKYPDSPVWGGHTFYGWDKNITSMPADNLTITALWASSTVTIVFSKKELGSGEIRDKIMKIASRESMTVTIITEYEDDDTVQYIVLFVDRSEAEVKEFAKVVLNNEDLKPAINHAEVNGQEWSSSGGDISSSNNTTVIVVVVVIVIVVAVLLGLLGFFLIMRRQSVAAAKALNGAWNRIAGVAADAVDARAFKSQFGKENKIYPKDYVPPQSIAAALINAGLDKDTANKAAEECRKIAESSSEKGRITGDLSAMDVEALCLYTLEFEEHEKSPYVLLNKALRAKKNKAKEIEYVRDLLYLVMKGLRKLPVVHKDRLYRGVREKLDAKEYKEESVVVWPAFSSTSPDMDVTKEFLKKVDEKGSTNGGDVELSNISRLGDNREENEDEGVSSGTLFIIEDGWGYDIQPYSCFSKEKEILLEPEQKFEVVSVVDSGDFLFITLRMRKTKAILPDLFGKRHDDSSKVVKE